MQEPESEARYMRRKVKAGLIEADHAECAIVVHYEVEATVLGELGEPIVAERQENTKRIKLKTLSENTNIPRLAEEIIEKCKLIHASKLTQVEQLLQELVAEQGRKDRGSSAAGGRRGKGEKKSKSKGGGGGEDETPSLDKLDQYMEAMYEEPEAATKATYNILQLARQAENLEPLLENEALLGLLARLLQEEGPKSMDLSVNILYILYSFSNFSQFHQLLSQARVGANVLEVVEREAKRSRVRELEQAKAEREGTATDPMEEKRERLKVRKQEKLLYVCFHVLLNLAEEPDVERKMTKRGIVGLLTSMLGRKQNTELLVLSLLFLMKLAIFKENLSQLRERPPKAEKGAQPALLSALAAFVPHQQESLLATSLRLLFNLSFDQQLRAAIVSTNAGLLPKLATLLRSTKGRNQLPLVLRLLYNLSAEPAARAAIGQTEAPRLIIKQVLSCGEPQLPLELAALAINVASDEAAAKAMAADGAPIRQLVDRLYQSRDPHLIKFMRNLAMHSSVGSHLLPFLADLIALAQQVEAAETLVEILGILGTLPLHEVREFPDLAAQYSLFDFLARYLTPGFTDDDVLLEVVIVLGQAAMHPQVAAYLAQSRILTSLYTLITEKQEDDEVVLQILYAFFHLLQAPDPRYALLQQTQLVIYLLDLLLDKCEAVRRMANLCLDVVIETDETWAPQIRQRKFQMHNKEWLEVVDEDEAEEYQDAVALNNAMASLHMNQPLDAAALDDAGYGEDGYGDDEYGVGLDAADYGTGGVGYPGGYDPNADGYDAYAVGGPASYGRDAYGLDAYGRDGYDLNDPAAGVEPSLAHEAAALNNAMASYGAHDDGYGDQDDGYGGVDDGYGGRRDYDDGYGGDQLRDDDGFGGGGGYGIGAGRGVSYDEGDDDYEQDDDYNYGGR